MSKDNNLWLKKYQRTKQTWKSIDSIVFGLYCVLWVNVLGFPFCLSPIRDIFHLVIAWTFKEVAVHISKLGSQHMKSQGWLHQAFTSYSLWILSASQLSSFTLSTHLGKKRARFIKNDLHRTHDVASKYVLRCLLIVLRMEKSPSHC